MSSLKESAVAEHRAEARAVLAFLQGMRQAHPGLTVTEVIGTLSLYLQPQQAPFQVAEELGVSLSHWAKVQTGLERGRSGSDRETEGLQWLTVAFNPDDRRLRQLSLTAKGRKAVETALTAAKAFVQGRAA